MPSCTIPIAGYAHYDGISLASDGDELVVVAEPGNRYDPAAILLGFPQGESPALAVGYIPRPANLVVKELLPVRAFFSAPDSVRLEW